MRTIAFAAAALMLAAAGARADDPEYYIKDFYIGMPLADFTANFAAGATLISEGTYAFAGYPDQGMELVFADVGGSQYLTAITASRAIADFEEGIRELSDEFGEPEYDSGWVPARTDCNDGPMPVRTISWYNGLDLDLLLVAKKNFEGQRPPADLEVDARFTMADGYERDGRHPWLETKLAAAEGGK